MGNVIQFPRARLTLNLDDYVNPYYDITNPIQPPMLPQNWQDQALCLTASDPNVFFTTTRRGLTNEQLADREAKAKAYCQLCPVQPECLTDALMRNEDNGVWGGTNGKERKRILRQIGPYWQVCKNCGRETYVKFRSTCCRKVR